MSPDPVKTGLLLVGVRGSIGTTVLHGLEAMRGGQAPVGLVTETPQFARVPWEDLGGFRVLGWDIGGDSHRAAADLSRIGVLPHDLVELCAGLRDRLNLTVAPGVPEPEDANLSDRASADRLALSLTDAVDALREDIRSWKQEEGLRRMVVVYLATAERQRTLPDEWLDESADPIELLKTAPHDLSR